MGRVSDAKQRLMDAVMALIWESSYGSTTIDAICEKAKVKKGSFYYFFDSKSDLASTALEADWLTQKPELDSIFSPTALPLSRLQRFFEMVYQKQSELKLARGRVLGCPLITLGSEISTQDPRLCSVIQGLLGQYRRYFESAIRDAHGQGLIEAPDSMCKAKCLLHFFEGALAEARIRNDVSLLKDLYVNALDLMGVRPALAA